MDRRSFIAATGAAALMPMAVIAARHEFVDIMVNVDTAWAEDDFKVKLLVNGDLDEAISQMAKFAVHSRPGDTLTFRVNGKECGTVTA